MLITILHDPHLPILITTTCSTLLLQGVHDAFDDEAKESSCDYTGYASTDGATETIVFWLGKGKIMFTGREIRHPLSIVPPEGDRHTPLSDRLIILSQRITPPATSHYFWPRPGAIGHRQIVGGWQHGHPCNRTSKPNPGDTVAMPVQKSSFTLMCRERIGTTEKSETHAARTAIRGCQ